MRDWQVMSVAAVLAAGLSGCAPAPAGPPPAAAATGAVVSDVVRESWQRARLNIVESADFMPEVHYDYRPVDSVRTFGEILTHLAGANYVFCSAAGGQATPHEEDAFEKTVTDREAIIRVLEESLVYCDAVYAAATDTSLAETVEQPFGGGPGPRAAVLLGNTAHLDEHYGNLVTYFRMKGLVPPSSRR